MRVRPFPSLRKLEPLDPSLGKFHSTLGKQLLAGAMKLELGFCGSGYCSGRFWLLPDRSWTVLLDKGNAGSRDEIALRDFRTHVFCCCCCCYCCYCFFVSFIYLFIYSFIVLTVHSSRSISNVYRWYSPNMLKKTSASLRLL